MRNKVSPKTNPPLDTSTQNSISIPVGGYPGNVPPIATLSPYSDFDINSLGSKDPEFDPLPGMEVTNKNQSDSTAADCGRKEREVC